MNPRQTKHRKANKETLSFFETFLSLVDSYIHPENQALGAELAV